MATMKSTLRSLFPMAMLLGGTITHAADQEEQGFIDPNIIEMAPFVVYGGIIDTVDGFTGKEYHEDNEVVLGFRETFNKLLLGYHRKLLTEEYENMRITMEVGKKFHSDLNALSGTFGISKIDTDEDRLFRNERVITSRLIKDPFFIIEALVVWDLDRLQLYKDRQINSKYARDIRYNSELDKWERRVTTEWRSSYMLPNGYPHNTLKQQGLNLDTNRGYHIIDNALGWQVVPSAFRQVKLTYPIFVNSHEPVNVQVQRLQATFIENLYHIYDPYSWAARRHTRFRVRLQFQNEFQEAVDRARLPVTDQDWFNKVLSGMILDILTIRHVGVGELYDYEMLTKIPARGNILGVGLDLLNWNPGEKRSVDYDPNENRAVQVNFNNPQGARWVLVDAYRRYGMQVIDLLRDEIHSLREQKRKVSGKQLLKSVLSRITGTDADRYIKLAEKAQKEELEKFRYTLL